MRKKIVIGLSFIFLLTACDKFTPTTNSKEPSNQTQKVQVKGDLLAQVGDWAIGTKDFQEYLQTLAAASQGRIAVDDITLDQKKALLEELVNTQILANEAELRGINRQPDVVRALAQQKSQLLAAQLTADIVKDVAVSDVEVENWYNDNKEALRGQEQRVVREIVLDSQADVDAVNVKLLVQKADFASVAKEYSVAETKDQGGLIESLSWNMDPAKQPRPLEVMKMAFSMQEGTVSPAFKASDDKFYIVKVESIKQAEIPPLDKELKERIRNALLQQKVNDRVTKIINDAKQRTKVTIKEDELN